MKKLVTILLTMCLLATLLVLPAAVQAEARGVMCSDAVVYTGPSDKYGELEGLRLYKGDEVTVRTQYWNGSATWLQVEFTTDGVPVRGYVPAAAVNARLGSVPVEAPLCAGIIFQGNPTVAAGPAYNGYLVYRSSIRQDASCIVYEVEDGWAHVEYWNFDLVKKCRAWVVLDVLKAEMPFGYQGYYGVAEDAYTSLYVPTPTAAPSTWYGETEGYPVGVMFTVVAGSCHIKAEPSEDAQTVGYAFVGERYKVLECMQGWTATGKDWYLVKQDGVYGWISSGLVSLER